jgi:hypothetical protein
VYFRPGFLGIETWRANIRGLGVVSLDGTGAGSEVPTAFAIGVASTSDSSSDPEDDDAEDELLSACALRTSIRRGLRLAGGGFVGTDSNGGAGFLRVGSSSVFASLRMLFATKVLVCATDSSAGGTSSFFFSGLLLRTSASLGVVSFTGSGFDLFSGLVLRTGASLGADPVVRACSCEVLPALASSVGKGFIFRGGRTGIDWSEVLAAAALVVMELVPRARGGERRAGRFLELAAAVAADFSLAIGGREVGGSGRSSSKSPGKA